MEHQSRTRLVTALVLAAVFGTGVLLGLAADSNVHAIAAEPPVSVTDSGPGDDAPLRLPMYQQVEPNESQLALIDSIVKEHRSRTNALDEQFRVDFRSIVLETRASIKGVFRPEQAAEYQRLLDEYDARRAAERENEDERD